MRRSSREAGRVIHRSRPKARWWQQLSVRLLIGSVLGVVLMSQSSLVQVAQAGPPVTPAALSAHAALVPHTASVNQPSLVNQNSFVNQSSFVNQPALTARVLSSAPQGAYAGSLSFSVGSLTPTVVTSDGPPTLTITGTLTNTTTEPIDALIARVQRGPALADEAALAAEVADPSNPEETWSDFADLLPTVPAGGTEQFTVTAPLYGVIKDTLAITTPGVYPIMVNVNGALPGIPDGARVGELHLLLTVQSVPAEIAAANPSTAPAPVPHQMNFVLPLVDRPHRDPTGAFIDDTLAEAISTGGRLANVLGQIETNQLPVGSITLAVDPELLEELELMTHGYFIGPIAFDLATRAAQLAPDDFGPQTPDGAATAPASTTSTSTTSTSTTSSTAPATTSGVVSSEQPAPTETEPGETEPGETEPGVTNPAGTGPGATNPAATNSAATNPAGATATTTAPGDAESEAGAPSSVDSRTGTSTGSGTTNNPGPTTPSTPAGPGSSDSAQSSDGAVTSADEPPATTPVDPKAPLDLVPADPATAVAGTGTAAAVQFLARLRALTSTVPVLVLPYSDADAVALTRLGMPSFLTETIDRGRRIATELLGDKATLITDVAWPVGGMVDSATLAAYQAGGYTSILLEPAAIGLDAATAGPGARIDGPAGTINAVIADAGNAGVINSILSGDPADEAARLNVLAAQLVLQAQLGTSKTSVLAPNRNYLPLGTGYATLIDLFNTLAKGSLVTGVSIEQVAAIGGGAAELTYPEDLIGTELRPATLGRITELGAGFAGLTQAFTFPDGAPEAVATQPLAPAGLFDPLLDGMYRQASAGLRGQPDLSAAMMAPLQKIITTVEASVFIVNPTTSFTLTSSDTPLLLSVRNDLPFPVQVKIQINSTDARRAGMAPDDDTIQVIPANNGAGQPIQIPNEITTSGQFIVRAQLTTPGGQAWGESVRLRLTSTAFGTITLVTVTAAGVIFLFSLAMRLRRRWRDRHDRSEKQARDAMLNSAVNPGSTSIPGHENDPAGTEPPAVEPPAEAPAVEPQPTESPAVEPPATQTPRDGT